MPKIKKSRAEEERKRMLNEYQSELERKGFLPDEIKPAMQKKERELLQSEENIGAGLSAEEISNRLSGKTLSEEQEKEISQSDILMKPIEEQVAETTEKIKKEKAEKGVPYTGNLLEKQAALLENIRIGATEVIPNVAEVYDALKSSLISRDTIKVQNAKQSFLDASNSIQRDIENVKLNNLSPINAERNIEAAINAISRLEEATKGIGKINLKFWVDKGAALEAQIAQEKALLESQRLELLRIKIFK